jgi:ribose transport system ATP-binding protein
MSPAGALRFDGIAKAFGGTQALKGVSFEVKRGEIVALLGENGAGKSTLIKILSGIHKADSGAIAIDGAPYHAGRRDSGHAVSFIHQDLGLIEWMTVAENVGLARGFARSSLFGRAGVIDWTRSAKAARDALSPVAATWIRTPASSP